MRGGARRLEARAVTRLRELRLPRALISHGLAKASAGSRQHRVLPHSVASVEIMSTKCRQRRHGVHIIQSWSCCPTEAPGVATIFGDAVRPMMAATDPW